MLVLAVILSSLKTISQPRIAFAGIHHIKFMKKCTIYIVTAFLTALPICLNARVWKEAGSERTIDGTFSKLENDKVVIIRSGGNAVKVDLAKLSAEDQSYAKELAEKNKPGAKFKWETDLDVAKKRAKDENKVILADFTGSDWCSWCIKLKKEVFDQDVFKSFAEKKLIMLEVDFPQAKKQSKSEKEQNAKLQKEFGISGYPTIILMDADGKKINQTGYQSGGPENYIKHIESLLK
jgi:thioredoxin-related protein